MEINHRGKINLSLHIIKKRQDGYHCIDTLMQEVDVTDCLVIERAKNTRLFCDHPDVPTDESNLILRAHRALDARYGIGAAAFTLQKRIPVGAGMGGGSANAAAALRGLNKLFALGLSKDELAEIGLLLGADVPFFLTGGTCRAQGIGEELTPLPAYRMPVLLVNDGTHAQTRAVYTYGPEQTPSTIPALITQLQAGKTELTVRNDLQKAAFHLYPKIRTTMEKVKETAPDTVQLSGTGATIYAIYKTLTEAKRAHDALYGRFPMVVLTQTCGEDASGQQTDRYF